LNFNPKTHKGLKTKNGPLLKIAWSGPCGKLKMQWRPGPAFHLPTYAKSRQTCCASFIYDRQSRVVLGGSKPVAAGSPKTLAPFLLSPLSPHGSSEWAAKGGQWPTEWHCRVTAHRRPMLTGGWAHYHRAVMW
jgi:hypothetical protein